MGNGYIIVPRGLFDAAEWRKKRVFGRTEAQLDLLYLASYVDGRVIHCASGDVVLRRGQLLTTMRTLAERWSWSPTSVHRLLSSLRQPKQGEIRIEIETQIETGKTLITIIGYDSWAIYDDETSFGTTPETRSETSFGTTTTEKVEHANSCNTTENGNERNNDLGQHGTPIETAPETPSGTRNGTILEIKYSNKGENKDNNTHTVDDYKGGVGGILSEAMALVQWVADTYPALAAKKQPLTLKQTEWLLRKHKAEDIRRIIAQVADNKRTTDKENVYCRIVTFFRYDKPVEMEDSSEKRYTWDEVLEAVNRGEVKTTGAFERIASEGRVYWIKKTK